MAEERYEESIRPHLGKATWGWYFIGMIMFVPFTILINYTQSQGQFNSTVIFVVMFVLSIILMWFMPRKHFEHLEGEDELGVFWMENPRYNELWWIAVGFILVFAESYAMSIFQQPFLGILIGGYIMLYILFKTRSILVVIIIHGVFNCVVLGAQAGFLGNSLVPLATSGSGMIPIIGNAIPSIQPIFSEFGFQLFLVAPTEEALKVAMIAGIIVLMRGSYTEDTNFKWVGGFFAVLVWAGLHYIISIR